MNYEVLAYAAGIAWLAAYVRVAARTRPTRRRHPRCGRTSTTTTVRRRGGPYPFGPDYCESSTTVIHRRVPGPLSGGESR